MIKLSNSNKLNEIKTTEGFLAALILVRIIISPAIIPIIVEICIDLLCRMRKFCALHELAMMTMQ